MTSSRDAETSTAALTTWLAKQPKKTHAYPKKTNRHLLSTRQDCLTTDEQSLLLHIKKAFGALRPADAAEKYFSTKEETHWWGWWQCFTPAYDGMLRKFAGETFTLPTRSSKDQKTFPLYAFADNLARTIANWQAERARNQDTQLIHDPVMLVLEELRDWAFNVLAFKECNDEDLTELAQRSSYLRRLIYIVPDFGQDRLRLHEIWQKLSEARQLTTAHITNRKLPELFATMIARGRDLEELILRVAHHSTNSPVDDNFSLECTNSDSTTCNSPISTVYAAAREMSSNSDALTHQLESVNPLYDFSAQLIDGETISVKPKLHANAADGVSFPTFMNDDDKQNYVRLIALAHDLSQVRQAYERIRDLASNIGTYVFAIIYREQMRELTANYQRLIDEAKQTTGALIERTDTGLHQLLSSSSKLRSLNRNFAHNLQTLETRVVGEQTLAAQLDHSSSAASTSSTHCQREIETLAADGLAQSEIPREMQVVHDRIAFLNKAFDATLNNKTLSLPSGDENLLLDAPPQASDVATTTTPSLELEYTWSDAQPHPVTGVAVYTQHCFFDGKEIGSLDFYGQKSLCRTVDGELNILKRTGFFAEQPSPNPNDVTEMCDFKLPSQADVAVSSAITAAKYGAIRGASNVLGTTLQHYGVSQVVAGRVSQLAYYSAYFTSRFVAHSPDFGFDNPQAQSHAVYQAAVETGQMWLSSLACTIAGNSLSSIGETLEQHQWHSLGTSVRKLGAIAQYGMFAVTAIEHGPVASVAAFASGAAAQAAVEEAGRLALI